MNIDDVVIGASEAAAPLGLDPFRSPMQFFAEKVGLKDDDEAGEAAWIGRYVEHALADMFADEHEVSLKKLESMFSLEQTWLRATVDRIIYFEDMTPAFRKAWNVEPGECIIVEAKTAGLVSKRPTYMLEQEWGAEGSDAIPPKYAVQVQLQASVLNEIMNEMGTGFISRIIVKSLIAGYGAPYYVVNYNPSIAGTFRQELDTFIRNHLVPEVPPEARDVKDWKAYVEAKRQKMTDKIILNATPEDVALIEQFRLAKEMRKEMEINEARLKAQLIDRIGKNYGIAGDFGRLLYTAGKESPRLRRKAFTEDLIPLLNSESRSENQQRAKFAQQLIELVKKHTRTIHTNRQLRAHFNDGAEDTEE